MKKSGFFEDIPQTAVKVGLYNTFYHEIYSACNPHRHSKKTLLNIEKILEGKISYNPTN